MYKIFTIIFCFFSVFQNTLLADPAPAPDTITYHITFPYTTGQTSAETIPLNATYTDLIQSNYVAGVLYGHMINATYPNIYFDKDYLYGSLFGQLMQENNNLHTYPTAKNNDNINTEPEYSQLLAVGQGGPYQINNFAVRLPDSTGIGLINYNALQKKLGFFIANQNQIFIKEFSAYSSMSPSSLENIYFGPIAAAYFQYNDLVSTFTANSPTWGPEYSTWPNCVTNLSNPINLPFLDILQNANYNAGLYSSIFEQYVNICSDTNKYATQLSNINNYGLSDSEYNASVGVNSSGTFILYPRQIRFYLDQLYNNNSKISAWITVNNNLTFSYASLEIIFAKNMMTLGYGSTSTTYTLITQQQGENAFTASLSTNNVLSTDIVSMNNSVSRNTMYSVINQALTNLETELAFKFTESTEIDLWQPYSIDNLNQTVTDTSATINWHVTNYNSSPIATSGGVILSGANETEVIATNNGDGNFTATITNLNKKTLYNYIAFNTIGGINITENLSSFTTSGNAPTITINNVVEPTDTTQTLSWRVIYSGDIANVTNSITYEKDSDAEINTLTVMNTPIDNTSTNCSVNLSSLDPGTKYFYTIDAVVDNFDILSLAPPIDTKYSGTFTTSGIPPTNVITIDTRNSFDVNYIQFTWYIYETIPSLPLTSTITFNGVSYPPYSISGSTYTYFANGLTPSTIYPFTIYATDGTVNSKVSGTISTEPSPTYVVIDNVKESTTTTDATLSWRLTYNENSNTISATIQYTKNGGTQIYDGPIVIITPIDSTSSNCSVILSNLDHNTNYNYTINAFDNNQSPGLFDGTFKTKTTPPVNIITINLDSGYPRTTSTTAIFSWSVTETIPGALRNTITFAGNTFSPIPSGTHYTYIANGLTPSTRYPYKIDAIDGVVKDEISSTIKTANEPSNIINSSKYSWTSQPKHWGVFAFLGATGGTPPYTYNIGVAREDGKPSIVDATRKNLLTYEITNMDAKVVYVVTVTAYDAHGMSSQDTTFLINNDWN